MRSWEFGQAVRRWRDRAAGLRVVTAANGADPAAAGLAPLRAAPGTCVHGH